MDENRYRLIAERLWDCEILSLVAQIHEYRVRQEYYFSQKPSVLNRLQKSCILQSAESSCSLAGLRVSEGRLKQIIRDDTVARDSGEEELAGYCYVLNRVMTEYPQFHLSADAILRLHEDLYLFGGASIGGRFRTDHPAAPDHAGLEEGHCDTADEVQRICSGYCEAAEDGSVDVLLLIAIFVWDFLKIHPFRDSNGRISRLLMNILLFQNGYLVGKYISLESIMAENADAYREAVSEEPAFIRCFLDIVLQGYRQLETRIRIADKQPNAVEKIRETILQMQGAFTKNDIMKLCPGTGRASAENSLTALVSEGVIIRNGRGRATWYIRADEADLSDEL